MQILLLKFINVFTILELRNEKCLSLLRIEMKFYKTSLVEQIAQDFNLIFVCFKLFLRSMIFASNPLVVVQLYLLKNLLKFNYYA
jgi:hypothetical protein